MVKDSKSYQICIVEDNPGDILLIEDYLSEQIALPCFFHARSFKEATNLISSSSVKLDVILLDLTLPDKNGEELITDIVGSANSCPVIILTGYADIDFSFKSLSLGVSDYLVKDDINSTSLYKSIVYSIERKKALSVISESENRYSQLFHLSPQPMWVYDLETLFFLDVNIAAEKKYGYSRNELLQMTIRDIRPTEDIPFLEKAVDVVRQHSSLFSQGIFRHQKRNGEIIHVDIKSNIINYKGRKAEVILANDITELLHAQESLKVANKNIVEIEEQERERFASEIHDGIAQNLVAIQLMFSGIAVSVPAVNAHPNKAILSETLEETIIECKEIVWNVRPKELIDKGLEVMLFLLLQKVNAIGKLKISMKAEASLDENFEYNERFHIYRILQENINNTVKYAHAETASILIVKQADEMEISFSDNGVGVSEDVLKTESSFLSIKRRIAVLNGSFEVFSNKDGGVSFQYFIPINGKAD